MPITLSSSCPSVDLGSCKFYGSVKSKRSDAAAAAVDGGDDGGEVSVFVWEGAERRRDGQTCIKRLKVRKEENKQMNCNNFGLPRPSRNQYGYGVVVYIPWARPLWFGTPTNHQDCSLVNREHTVYFIFLGRSCISIIYSADSAPSSSPEVRGGRRKRNDGDTCDREGRNDGRALGENERRRGNVQKTNVSTITFRS